VRRNGLVNGEWLAYSIVLIRGLMLIVWAPCYFYMWQVVNGFYRRQSGLRTIKGGICLGFLEAFWVLTQVMLLGYQRIVYSVGLKGSLFFLIFPNISGCSESKIIKAPPSSYRHICSLAFVEITELKPFAV